MVFNKAAKLYVYIVVMLTSTNFSGMGRAFAHLEFFGNGQYFVKNMTGGKTLHISSEIVQSKIEFFNARFRANRHKFIEHEKSGMGLPVSITNTSTTMQFRLKP